MFGILLAIEIIISIMLMIVILMQSSKGGGLAGSFGGASMGTMFGVRRTADFLGRSTTILATIFILLSLITNLFFLPGKKTSADSVIQRGATQTTTPRPLPPSNPQAPVSQPTGK